jgi:comEA protein
MQPFELESRCSAIRRRFHSEEEIMFGVCASALALVALMSVPGFSQSPASRPPQTTAAEKAPVVNLNTATVADLEKLPGIGARVAARIVEYRTQKGPFKKIEELMNVQGIGEKSFLKLRSQLTVTGGSASTAQQ